MRLMHYRLIVGDVQFYGNFSDKYLELPEKVILREILGEFHHYKTLDDVLNGRQKYTLELERAESGGIPNE